MALGAKPLDAEKSVNFSLGAVLRFGDLSITADAYRINIDNRIVLSENLTSAAVRNYLTSQGFTGVGGARFFINGVDTNTKGLDVVINWPWKSPAAGRFDFTLAGNYNQTEVTRVPVTTELAALNPAPALFGRSNVVGLEKGQPKNKITASVNWKLQDFGLTASATRYGDTISAGSTARDRLRGLGQDHRQPRRALCADQVDPAGVRRRQPVRHLPRRRAGLAEHHRRRAVRQPRAVWTGWAVCVCTRQLQILSALLRQPHGSGQPARR